MANAFPVLRVLHHGLAIFPFNWVPGLARRVLPFPACSQHPSGTAGAAAPAPCATRALLALPCPAEAAPCTGEGQGAASSPFHRPLSLWALRTRALSLELREVFRFPTGMRREQRLPTARSGFPIPVRVPPLPGGGSFLWCPGPGAPTASPGHRGAIPVPPPPPCQEKPPYLLHGAAAAPGRAAAAAATTAAAPARSVL